MISRDDAKNPFVAYLKQEGITPGDFAIIARVDNVSVYDVRKAHFRILPKSFVQAIDVRSGGGKGEGVASAYLRYREALRDNLMMNKK
ncbi:hypothetical protein [Candidatus Cryosericum septentrionale]|jgi:hypothetical protein|uniref:Uncharacterized protein n=1 Tax=Candidatus Cryosericum septentrionale TaxID=2290913 RepID=A0A398DYH7_9BACT|nr:hypothetical protein [Candidatus Cryosericum septentrionale]RIE16947.1 hypothetical protein SMC1_03845 [Candidatus Cryosericum septentrionale]